MFPSAAGTGALQRNVQSCVDVNTGSLKISRGDAISGISKQLNLTQDGICTISHPRWTWQHFESDSSLRGKLAAIGLETMADWVTQGCQTGAIPGWIIVTCAAMFTEYLGEVPQTQGELEGTPYLETQDIADNLEDNGCVHYRKPLEPCFRNTFRYPHLRHAQLSISGHLFANLFSHATNKDNGNKKSKVYPFQRSSLEPSRVAAWRP